MTSELENACIYLRPKPLTELDAYLPIPPLQDSMPILSCYLKIGSC